jgi:hypothetical protein
VFSSPHPALDMSKHLLPGLKSFFQHGDGLGLALPAIKTWSHERAFDAAKDFVTQAPFETARNHIASWYTSHEALNASLGIVFWLSTACWVLQEATGNASIVDRLWTFLPVLYSAHFTFFSHFAANAASKKLFSWSGSHGSSWQQAVVPEGVDPRMFLVFVLQCLWSLRLSTNSLRRGFASFTEEDYVRRFGLEWCPTNDSRSAGPSCGVRSPSGSTRSSL